MQPFKVKGYITKIYLAQRTHIDLGESWVPGFIEPPCIVFAVKFTDLNQERTPEETNAQLTCLMEEGAVEVTIAPVKKQMSNMPKWDNPAY